MDRVFLDANVLFSAAYRPDAGLRGLWNLGCASLLSSAYAVEEARRNLDDPGQRADLELLLATVSIMATTSPDRPTPADEPLPEKDRPILLAAIDLGATHLLTGDVRHFGRLFGSTVEGVLILPPAESLRLPRQ